MAIELYSDIGFLLSINNITFFGCLPLSSKAYPNNEHADTLNKLAHYLAGLIEGDGSIKVPKSTRSKTDRLLYPVISIIFNIKDLPLANFLGSVLGGRVNFTKGNWVVLNINKVENIYYIVKTLNGKFRTPKIEALHRLIKWYDNYGKFPYIKALTLDDFDLSQSGWLSGF